MICWCAQSNAPGRNRKDRERENFAEEVTNVFAMVWKGEQLPSMMSSCLTTVSRLTVHAVSFPGELCHWDLASPETGVVGRPRMQEDESFQIRSAPNTPLVCSLIQTPTTPSLLPVSFYFSQANWFRNLHGLQVPVSSLIDQVKQRGWKCGVQTWQAETKHNRNS